MCVCVEQRCRARERRWDVTYDICSTKRARLGSDLCLKYLTDYAVSRWQIGLLSKLRFGMTRAYSADYQSAAQLRGSGTTKLL